MHFTNLTSLYRYAATAVYCALFALQVTPWAKQCIPKVKNFTRDLEMNLGEPNKAGWGTSQPVWWDEKEIQIVL
ncbi:hypothetical protein PP707_02175 [Acetobacter pasteurianus]|nr:hypothetical protein [Acetobacter pasteurianus]